MAKEKKAAVEKQETKESTAAAAAGAAATAKPATKSTKIGKLLPKNKSRLPRKQKKALKKKSQ